MAKKKLTTLLESPSLSEAGSAQSSATQLLNKTLAGVAVFTFVGGWIASSLSPLLLYLFLNNQCYKSAFVLVLLSASGLAPFLWKHIKQDHPLFLIRWLDAFLTHYFIQWPVSVKVLAEDWNSNNTTNSINNNNSKERQPTFYAIHPHGAFCIGWAVLYTNAKVIFQKDNFDTAVRFCYAPLLYMTPMFRILANATGTPGNADKSAMLSYMKSPNPESLALLPGGLEEASITKIPTAINKQSDDHTGTDVALPCTERLYLKNRAGFIKLALSHEYAIRPIFVFGESFLFSNLQGGWNLRLLMNRYWIPALIPWGWYGSLLPYPDIKLTIVIGTPVDFSKILGDAPTTNLSREAVKQCHDHYIKQLLKLYDDHKEEAYGPELAKRIKLELW